MNDSLHYEIENIISDYFDLLDEYKHSALSSGEVIEELKFIEELIEDLHYDHTIEGDFALILDMIQKEMKKLKIAVE